MPFIHLQTNQTITSDQETALKTAFGQAVALIPHKNEQSLMLTFAPETTMYLAGQKDMPMALLSVAVWGNSQHLGYENLSVALTQAVSQILAIPPNHIYIKYEDIAAWGVAGQTFSGAK